MKKKKNAPRNWRQFSVLAGILVLVIAWAIAWFVMKELSKPNPMAYADEQHAIHEQAYREARELWDAQGIVHYRYTLTAGYNQSCTATIEIINNNHTILSTENDYCDYFAENFDSLSIDNIFDKIEDLLKARECGPNGCICDGYIVPIVEYNASQGFPIDFDIYYTENQISDPDALALLESGYVIGPDGRRYLSCTLLGGGYLPLLFTIQDLETLPDS